MDLTITKHLFRARDAHHCLRKALHYSLLSASLLFVGCGGGEVTQFSDDDFESPSIELDDDSNPVTPAPGADPITGDDAEELPSVSAGNNQSADSNVIVTLNGSADAANSASIDITYWEQISGPSVVIPNPDRLINQFITPDVLESTQLQFRLYARDSEGRTNASTTTVRVEPIPLFARVIGGVVDEGDTTASFIVKLNGPQAADVSVDFTTVDGTAEAGVDYEALAGTVVIPAGETEVSIDVPIFPGNVSEENETFVMQITVLDTNDTYSANTGIVLIRDNPIVLPPPPELPALQDTELQTYTVGEAIETFALVNEGEGGITECFEVLDNDSSSILGLLGITLTVSEDASTCEIGGTPSRVSEFQSVVIAAVNADGQDEALLRITVEPALAAPVLTSAGDREFTVGTPIAAFEFSNSGGGEITACRVIGGTLPPGLALDITEDTNTCEISGTPTAPAGTTLLVEAENAAGADSETVNITVSEALAAPALVDLPEQTLTTGVAFSVNFDNTGGGDISECTHDQEVLPDGVILTPTEDLSTCLLSGTIADPQTFSFVVTATNATASSEANVTLVVEAALQAPQLTNLADQTFTQNTAITPLSFVNTGGGTVTNCEDTLEALPAGLSFSISEDQSTCLLSGTPTVVQGATTARVTASNAAGDGFASVTITVESDLAAPALALPVDTSFVYTQGTAITPVVFTNSGGSELTLCEENNAEPVLTAYGLSVSVTEDASTCVLSGTPSLVSEGTSTTITGTNAGGTGSVAITFEVQPAIEPTPTPTAPPLFPSPNPTPSIFFVGQTITPEEIQNLGGQQITACETDAGALPAGLSIDPTADGTTCVLSGTPEETLETSFISFTGTNAVGSFIGTLHIGVLPGASPSPSPTPTSPPEFVEPLATPEVYPVGQAITPTVLTNLGGDEITICLASFSDGGILPDGLTVSPTEDGTSCQVTGTPTEGTAGAYSVDITGTNAAGSDTVTLFFDIVAPSPELVELPPLVFTVGETIDTITIGNNGGGDLFSCSGTMPFGLRVDRSEDNATCIITGTPTVPQEATDYNVSATNYFSDTITVSITIEDLVFSDPITLAFDNASSLLMGLALSSGTARVDWGDGSEPVDVTNQDITLLQGSTLTEGFVRVNYEEPISGEITVSFSDGIESLIGFAPLSSYEFDISVLAGATDLRVIYATIISSTINGEIETVDTNHPLIEDLRIGGLGNFGGDLAEVPNSVTNLYLSASAGIVTGGLSDLPTNLAGLSINRQGGNKTVGGLLSELPDSLVSVTVRGDNTIGGDIANLPSNLESLEIMGDNFINGDIGSLTSNAITSFTVQGFNTIAGFSEPTTWAPENLTTFVLSAGSEVGLSAEEVDRLLIFFDDILGTTTTSFARITLARSGDEAPTADSAEAIISLEAKGYTVSTNGLRPQQIAFDTDEPIFGFIGETYERPIVELGEGTGAITYASDNENVSIDPTTGEFVIDDLGEAIITATKAADATYAAATASYRVAGLIGTGQYLTASSDLPSEEGSPLSNIIDGNINFGEFLSTSPTGTITLFPTFSDGTFFNIDSLVLWNGVDAGVTDITIFFLDENGQPFEVQTTTNFTPLIQEGAQEFTFRVTATPVYGVQIDINNSEGAVSIREIGLIGTQDFIIPLESIAE